jgi:hypothetical protein
LSKIAGISVSTVTATQLHTPIAGVMPAETKETLIMTVWPSNAAWGLGRILGGLYALRFPDVYIFRIGNLIALASIPIALVIYLSKVLPFIAIRYSLTNRRVVVQRGLQAKDDKSVDLDRFDSVQVDVLPGQAWYNAGDLVFKLGNVETFRLNGVSRPEAFRQTIMKAHMVQAGVKKTRR